MIKHIFLSLIFVFTTVLMSMPVSAQDISGRVVDKSNGQTVEFVNIGIVGKDVGTVSAPDGTYSLTADSSHDGDTIAFSCIGYEPFAERVADFKARPLYDIALAPKAYAVKEVVVKPRQFKDKVLGYSNKNSIAVSGFDTIKAGYECGVIMKNKGYAELKSIEVNFREFAQSDIKFRINVYQVKGDMQFENILTKPIYHTVTPEMSTSTVVIDMTPHDLVTTDDFLVTLEFTEKIDKHIYFPAKMLVGKTFFRKTSQGIWRSLPVGISISTNVRVAK